MKLRKQKPVLKKPSSDTDRYGSGLLDDVEEVVQVAGLEQQDHPSGDWEREHSRKADDGRWRRSIVQAGPLR